MRNFDFVLSYNVIKLYNNKMKKGSHEHFKTEISSVRGDKHAVIVNL